MSIIAIEAQAIASDNNLSMGYNLLGVSRL